MRAKRSKKYRKIMSNYALHFSFRTPYQVLCDSNFLRQCHAFHMPVQRSLENTLHGDARPYITQCSLARAKEEEKGRGRGDGKPIWLPPPMEVPLRYCKHKDAEGNEVEGLSETECLVELLGGQPRGNELPKNKNHYVLATAEREEVLDKGKGRKRKRDEVDVREVARQVAGVPIIYVKRSVMVLEELSNASERTIRGVEKAKFKEGLVGAVRGVKRQREDDEELDSDEDGGVKKSSGPRGSNPKRAKGPNPLSMRKKKVRNVSGQEGGDPEPATIEDGEGQKKRTRKRRHGKKSDGEDGQAVTTTNFSNTVAVTSEV